MATIDIVNEDGTSVHPTLREMERTVWKVEAWAARHGTSLTPIGERGRQHVYWMSVGRC